MGTVHPLPARPEHGQKGYRATICLGIGDDDAIDAVLTSQHHTERQARSWTARELPGARFPDWVACRPHGTAGAFLYGQIEPGHYINDAEHGLTFEPDPDAPTWDANLLGGVLQWQPAP